MAHRYALRDDQWARIADLLPGREGTVGVTAKDNRLFVEAVLWRMRTGAPWRDVPECFGPWKTVYNRFANWAKRDIWSEVFRALGVEADETAAIVDGSVVRAHQDAAGGKGGSATTDWALVEVVFRPSSTRSSTRNRARSMSS